MPHISRNDAQVKDVGPVLVRSREALGYRIDFVTFKTDIDATPLLKGLPHDLCSAAHWGYVLKGTVTFRFLDGHEEVFVEGDAFYAPAPHTSRAAEGTEYLQFSPDAQLKEVEAVMMKNMAAMKR